MLGRHRALILIALTMFALVSTLDGAATTFATSSTGSGSGDATGDHHRPRDTSRPGPSGTVDPDDNRPRFIDPLGSYDTPRHVLVPSGSSTPGQRPNIVLITTDDMAATDLAYMPQTRRLLASKGTRFTNMLAPHPLCCPSRAQILTGQYAQNNGVHSNGGPYGGYPALREPDNTLPAWLQSSGYFTAMVGKFLNGYRPRDGVPTGWDYWNTSIDDSFGYYGFSTYNNGMPVFYPPASGVTSTDLIGDVSVQAIKALAGATRPFFVWSSFYAPHGVCGDNEGCTAPPEYTPEKAALFRNLLATSFKKPSYNERDVDDKPRSIATRPTVDNDTIQTLFLSRLRALASVDDEVARIVHTLARTGELDNTLIVFTSDNGYLLGEHRYVGKVLAYEEALKVPLLIRGPDVPRHATRGQTVTMIDLAPTFMDWSGATPGRRMDGRPVTSYLRDDAHQPDTTVLVQGGPKAEDKNPHPWLYRGVRTDRYTYTRSHNGFVEMYDRKRDPFQLVNVGADPAYRSVMTELERRTHRLGRCAGSRSCQPGFPALPEVR